MIGRERLKKIQTREEISQKRMDKKGRNLCTQLEEDNSWQGVQIESGESHKRRQVIQCNMYNFTEMYPIKLCSIILVLHVKRDIIST